MTYSSDAFVSKSTLKNRIEYEGEDFYDINPESGFDDLLAQLEKESRDAMNNYKGSASRSVTFNIETDRVDEYRAPGSRTIPLVYPIQDGSSDGTTYEGVKEVEIKRRPGQEWSTLGSDAWDYTKHHLILERYAFPLVERLRRNVRLLNRRIDQPNWSDLSTKVRVTYDRGYLSIPDLVKSIQINIINRMLGELRQGQNIEALKPEEMGEIIEGQKALVDKEKDDLDNITSAKAPIVSV